MREGSATNAGSRVVEVIVNAVGEVAREAITARNEIARITDGGGNTAGGLDNCVLTQFNRRRC